MNARLLQNKMDNRRPDSDKRIPRISDTRSDWKVLYDPQLPANVQPSTFAGSSKLVYRKNGISPDPKVILYPLLKQYNVI